ncbi:hypothetical protein LCGC14_0504590 [marine sediment metagenome]|uniref:PD-(D/E)XK endonuclease-like domain-containing protein n=1 Tax=marine sediment metagenome TaxID=412755 RepID=A0A0F9S809_9ZZZZ
MSVFDSILAGEEPSIKRMLHEAIPGRRPPRDHKILHASDLTKEEEFCPRQFALYDLTGGKPRDEWIGTSQQTTFDVGKMMQALLREHWMPQDKVIGHWECKWCGTVLTFRPRPSRCAKCKKNLFKYNEVTLYSEELGVWGGLDILVNVGESKLRMVELKIIDKNYWADLQMPMAEHTWRTQLYLKIIGTSRSKWADQINSNVAHILYKGRMFGKKDAEAISWNSKDRFSPFKEYLIERNDKAVDLISIKAKMLKSFREQGKDFIPPGVCASGFDARARFCPVAPSCFSGKWPVLDGFREDET